MTLSRKDTASSDKHAVLHIKLSNGAIAGLILSVILPWIILGLVVFHRPPVTPSENLPDKYNKESEAHTPHYQIESGPWGFIEESRIIIQPPLSFIDFNLDMQPYRQWTFKNTSLTNIQQLLTQSGLNEDDIRTLSEKTAGKPDIKGFIISPPDELLLRMPPKVRATLYAALSLDRANKAQAEPFRFCGSSIYEWFDHSDVNPDIIEKIKPLIYKRGKYMLFSDLHLILNETKTINERIQLLRTLHRASSLRIRIRGNRQNIDSILDYWGRGNRHNEVEPLMVSLADQSQNMSIVVLLPTFARTRIYTYDSIPGGRDSLTHDCHWTSFNFFNETPDESLTKPGILSAIISREYDRIANPSFLGDIILIMHDNNAVHSCVYIADDVVFTKNGCGEGDPFIFEKFEDVAELYQQQYGEVSMAFVRRKDIK